METAVRKATRSSSTEAPKAKHLRVLIDYSSRADITSLDDMFHIIYGRLHESNWAIVFKALITIHILMRDETCGENILRYLAARPAIFNVSDFKDKSGSHGEQAKNIHAYAAYLEEKTATFADLKVDIIRTRTRGSSSTLRKVPLSEGLLTKVRVLQRQLNSLLSCKFFIDDVDNVITLEAFRLLIHDLLSLFQVVNEGIINMLEHYFEMKKADAQSALKIYKEFTAQTEKVVDYLGVAKRLQGSLRLTIPTLKHAPVSLATVLEQYINSPDFEENREAYRSGQIASKEKKTNEFQKTSATVSSGNPAKANTSNSSKPEAQKEIDMIDFFGSLEQEQTVVFETPPSAGLNTVQPLANLNSYGMANFPLGSSAPITTTPQQNSTPDSNPFRLALNQSASMVSTTTAGTNPFRCSLLPNSSSNPFASPQQLHPQPQPLIQQQQTQFSWQTQQPTTNTSISQSGAFSSWRPTDAQLPMQQLQNPTDRNPFRDFSNPTGATSTTSSIQNNPFSLGEKAPQNALFPLQSQQLQYQTQQQQLQSKSPFNSQAFPNSGSIF
ncbi:uncharacterized protein VTP21DRAFT_3062 [Calcarisporiella thermophila]|uniref:uncharacterized protein n=1 Tax=Calcarisporiella thermophila TaxID=911321 RepID=UPI003743EBDA